MSTSPWKPSANELRRQLRVRGYEDGLAGREPRYTDVDYMRSFRRGLERRDAVKGER
jgi:hypothetical protein